MPTNKISVYEIEDQQCLLLQLVTATAKKNSFVRLGYQIGWKRKFESY